MSEYTITAVGGMKPWTGEHGTFHIYDIEWDGTDGAGKGSIKQKDSTAAPTVGLVLDAEVVKRGDFPPELKRLAKQNGGGGGGGWKPKSPEELRSINRSVAQKNAILLLGVEVQAGKSFEGESASKLLKPRIDFLFDDLQKAAEG